MCKIEFEIPKAGYVTVKVVDIIGKPVKSLINSHKEAGRHIIDFNNEELAPGKYYYKVILSKDDTAEVINENEIVTQGKLKIGRE
jgi:hypothetical protein